MIKLKDVDSMINFKRICSEEGFDEVSVHHVGGFWLWLHFKSVDACNAFKQNVYLNSLYSVIKPISKNFIVDERFVWVEITGLPLCAWGSNGFKKVASSFGKFLFFENERSTAMCLGRVCLATRHMRFISEEITVVVHGMEFDVHVQEVGSWCMDIEDKSHSISDSGSSSGDELNKDDYHEVDMPGDDLQNYETEDCNKKENSVVNLEESTQSNKSKEERDEAQVNSQDSDRKEVSSDYSRPPGFDNFIKIGTSDRSLHSKDSKCSTSFAKSSKKHVRGISVLHELDKIIELGETLGYDVKDCQNSFHKIIDRIGVNMVDK